MKNLIAIIVVILISNNVLSQTLIDSFSDGNFTSSPVWSGDNSSWTIVTNSDVAAGATGSYTLRLDHSSSSGTQYLSTQITDWGSTQEWGFFIGRRSQAFTSSNQMIIWLYANESTLESSTVDGYRIIIGDNSGDDDIVLQYVLNGSPSSTIITSSTAINNGLTDIGFLIRVTRNSSGLWTLYTSTIPPSPGTGAIATDIPNSTNANTNQGSGTNNTLSLASNGYFGLVAIHSSGTNARSTVEFDQFYFTKDQSLASEPTTQASGVNFTSVQSSQFTINWTSGNGSNRIVLVKSGSAVNSDPVDGTSYTANTVFGSGTEIGTGNFVVYNSTSNSVTVTGLNSATTYYVAVYEFNGSPGTENYLTTSPATGNQTTATASLGLQISSSNTLYTIDFDNTVSGVTNGQFNGSGFTTSPSSGQINSNAWELTGMSDGSLNFGGSGTSGDYARGSSIGGESTGGIYAFSVSTGNYSLGFQPGGSDWTPGTVTLKIQNQVGSTITSLSVCYRVYVYNDQGRSSSFNFSYSSNNSTYTDISSLDLTSVEVADASHSWKLYLRTVNITGTNIGDEGYYYLRWSGDDVSGGGSRDEFALDDIIIVANPTSIYPSFSGTIEEGVIAGNSSLSEDLTVNTMLTLTEGLLTIGDYNLTLESSATISGTPSSSNMIVATGSGELRKTFTGTGSFTFPLGDNTGTAEYSPVTLDFTSGTFSSAYTGVNLKNEKNSNNSSATDYLNRYWTITQSGISSFSCDVAFTYVDEDVVGNENNLYCGSWNGSTWTLLNVVNTSTNTLSGTVSSFSTFTGGEQGALPVELTSFTSSITDNSVKLTWSTAGEVNNSGFDVERKKTESSSWQKIGFVQGHGNTNTPQSYSFLDRFLSTEKFNYRLKQIDFNGNYHYYYLGSEVSIGVPKKFKLSQNFPNPFNPVTKISYELPNDSKVSIKIFDMLGREVGTLVDEFKTAGYHTIDFDGNALSSGMYFYRIKTNEFEAIKKMLLIK